MSDQDDRDKDDQSGDDDDFKVGPERRGGDDLPGATRKTSDDFKLTDLLEEEHRRRGL